MWDVFCYRMKGSCPSLPQASGTQLLSHLSPARPSPRGSPRGSRVPCLTAAGPHVFLPSRCQLHLQGGLRGRRLLVQWESAAGPDVLPLPHELPDGTFQSACFCLGRAALPPTSVRRERRREGRAHSRGQARGHWTTLPKFKAWVCHSLRRLNPVEGVLKKLQRRSPGSQRYIHYDYVLKCEKKSFKALQIK